MAQSWAVISGSTDALRQAEALKSAEKLLVKTEEKLVLLLTPPFDKTPLDPGYIKGYPPGVRENGGQYTHGSLWLPMAFARKGEGEKAVQLLRLMHPQYHALNEETVQRYKVEPYAVCADIYDLPGQIGRGGWTWYTGSSAWMYRVWIEEVIGFTLRGDRLSFKPILPPSWEKVQLSYHHKSSLYEITLEHGKEMQLQLDGVTRENQEIALLDDGRTHTVHLIFV